MTYNREAYNLWEEHRETELNTFVGKGNRDRTCMELELLSWDWERKHKLYTDHRENAYPGSNPITHILRCAISILITMNPLIRISFSYDPPTWSYFLV